MSQLSHAVVAATCLNATPPRVPITWEAYARAADPALGAPPAFQRGTPAGRDHWAPAQVSRLLAVVSAGLVTLKPA
jgi:hypothetical protein